MFYLNTVATESESVQRLGIVRVGYFHQSYPRGGPDQDLIRMSVQMIEAVPIRSVAFYLVAGSSLWSQTMDLIVLLARPWLRVRTRIVSGTSTTSQNPVYRVDTNVVSIRIASSPNLLYSLFAVVRVLL
jgi:hypothetical protein